jgi:hypothetical protein
MEPLFYVMAIMGCSDGGGQCAQQRIEPVHYSSIQQCQTAMPAALMRNTDLDYPEISAACQAHGTNMVKAGGKTPAHDLNG